MSKINFEEIVQTLSEGKMKLELIKNPNNEHPYYTYKRNSDITIVVADEMVFHPADKLVLQALIDNVSADEIIRNKAEDLLEQFVTRTGKYQKIADREREQRLKEEEKEKVRKQKEKEKEELQKAKEKEKEELRKAKEEEREKLRLEKEQIQLAKEKEKERIAMEKERLRKEKEEQKERLRLEKEEQLREKEEEKERQRLEREALRKAKEEEKEKEKQEKENDKENREFLKIVVKEYSREQISKLVEYAKIIQ